MGVHTTDETHAASEPGCLPRKASDRSSENRQRLCLCGAHFAPFACFVVFRLTTLQVRAARALQIRHHPIGQESGIDPLDVGSQEARIRQAVDRPKALRARDAPGGAGDP